MKKSNGFAIIETLIVVVMMTTSLLLVYSTYNSNIKMEKERLYYDDVVDIYKINAIKNYIIENSYLEDYINNIFISSGTDIISRNIGASSGDLFFDTDELIIYLDFYNVSELIILRTDYEIISNCTYDIIKNSGSTTELTETETSCVNSFGSYTYELIDYIRSLGYNTDFTSDEYILIAVFDNDFNSKYTYTYISLGEF